MQQELRRSHDNDHVENSRARRKFGQSSEVLREQIREVPKELVGTCQVDRCKSRSLPEVRRRITEGSSDDRRKFTENLPEEAIDAPEHAAEYVLGNNRS